MDCLQLIGALLEEYIVNIFKLIFTLTYLLFSKQYFAQTNSVAISSPLSSIVANLCMEDFDSH